MAALLLRLYHKHKSAFFQPHYGKLFGGNLEMRTGYPVYSQLLTDETYNG
jgi:hypothetical protein